MAGVKGTQQSAPFPSLFTGLWANRWDQYGNLPLLSTMLEYQAVTVPAGAGFTSLGIIDLSGGAISRLKANINVNSQAVLPAGGLQVQINYKVTPNSNWLTAWSWAAIQALAGGPGEPTSTPPLIVYAPGQSSIILPATSDTIFELDVRNLHAVDFQVSTTAGSYSAAPTLFANLRRFGG